MSLVITKGRAEFLSTDIFTDNPLKYKMDNSMLFYQDAYWKIHQDEKVNKSAYIFRAHPAFSHCSHLLLKIKGAYKYKSLAKSSKLAYLQKV